MYTKVLMLKRCISFFILLCFTYTSVIPPAYAQEMIHLPIPGQMLDPSPVFNFPIIKGLTIHPENPLQFDFLIDPGQGNLSQKDKQIEYQKIIKYFLASLTVPEKDLWVNLSPYEKNRMIPDSFGKTEMGRDLLAQDYILKQITASLMYPEKELGKSFWNKVYQEAQNRFGNTDIPVNTFNKVWIVPDKASVYEKENTVFLVEGHLKVMLEEDYLAIQKHHQGKGTNSIGSQIIREIILPAIEEEVNQGKNFANLRQITNSLILATWYKTALKQSLLNKIYADKSKVEGVNLDDPKDNQKIYQRYLQAFKKGVYNYIKEESDPVTKEFIPRKYFSGGFSPDLDGVMLGQRIKQLDLIKDAALIAKVTKSTFVLDQTQVLLKDVPNHPYGNESFISRELDKLFQTYIDFHSWLSKKRQQRVLLVGVGRGLAAMQLALRYPNLEIIAVNKESDLWSDKIIGDYLVSTGVRKKDVTAARKRITLNIVDLDSESGKQQIFKERYDAIIFEPFVLIYFRDKVKAIEAAYNALNPNGFLGFEKNRILASNKNKEEEVLNVLLSSLAAPRPIIDTVNSVQLIKKSSKKINIPLKLKRSELAAIPNYSSVKPINSFYSLDQAQVTLQEPTYSSDSAMASKQKDTQINKRDQKYHYEWSIDHLGKGSVEINYSPMQNKTWVEYTAPGELKKKAELSGKHVVPMKNKFYSGMDGDIKIFPYIVSKGFSELLKKAGIPLKFLVPDTIPNRVRVFIFALTQAGISIGNSDQLKDSPQFAQGGKQDEAMVAISPINWKIVEGQGYPFEISKDKDTKIAPIVRHYYVTFNGKRVTFADRKQSSSSVLYIYADRKIVHMESFNPLFPRTKEMRQKVSQDLGGIDLNPRNFNLQIKRDGKGVPLPVEFQDVEHINVRGFIPVIIKITPVSNLRLLLGMAENKELPKIPSNSEAHFPQYALKE